MTKLPTTELILLEATPIRPAAPVTAPGQEPEHVQAALKRCRTAWQRAYKAELDKTNGNEGDDVVATFLADKAYRKAMPIISTQESIQAYIACATHGILIGAIAPNECGQIFYAAQVALNTLQCQSKSPKNGAA